MAFNGLQGGGGTSFIQGAAMSGSRVQPTSSTKLTVQPASSGSLVQATAPASSLQGNKSTKAVNGIQTTASVTSNPNTSVAIDPAAAAKNAADAKAAAQAAADAARAGQLRGEITGIINKVKDLLNSRYGQIDSVAAEQAGNLDSRFTKESGDITQQATDNTNQAAGAFAGRGTKDSSDYGNSVDTITRGADSQIQDLGTELGDNKAAIGQEVLKEKAGIDAQKSSHDAVLKHLGEETDPGRLTDLRNSIDAKLAEVQAGNADNTTGSAARSALATIAPSNARVQQLQTTLTKIVGGNAPSAQKSAVAQSLVTNSGLDPADQQKLLQAFSADVATTDKQQVQQ